MNHPVRESWYIRKYYLDLAYMKIVRRISGKIESASMKGYLEGILNENLESNYFSKDLEEDSNQYLILKKVINEFNLHDSVIGTSFTDDEILDSEILCFTGGRPFAYPQPEGPLFLENTYSDSCRNCGIFGEQKQDFIIKKEPNLKRNSLVALHWVFGELFSEKNLYEDFFKGLGLKNRPVKINKSDKFAESVVQIVLPKLECDLKMKDLEFSQCSECGLIKYIPSTVGYFPRPEKTDFSIANTREFFGSGHSAYHKILLTNKVMRDMMSLKIAKKHQFIPCR